MGEYSVGDHVLLLAVFMCPPDVLDGLRILARTRGILYVFVGIFAVRVEYDLAYTQGPGSVTQVKDGLQDNLRGVGLARAGHTEQAGLLREQVGGHHFYRYI